MRIMLLFLLVLGLSVTCRGEASVKANFAVWTESSLKKVIKSASVGKLEPVTVSAARNEREAFQVVLRAGREPLEQVSISISDLKSNEAVIPASNIDVFLPSYIYLPKYLQHYPDPLPPYQKPFTLQPGQTQPVWINVTVPNDAEAGDYNGTLYLKPANGDPVTVPFKLHVYDFALPEDWKMTTAFGIWQEDLAKQHGVDVNSEEYKELYKKYYEFLLDHGVSPFLLPVDLLSEEAEKYLKDPRMTSFTIPYTEDAEQQKKLLDRVRALGVWDKSFFYFVDEPVNEDLYKRLQDGCAYLKNLDPDVNIVSPYFTDPKFKKGSTVYDLLKGHINIWCFNTHYYHPDALAERRAAGEKIWNYVCCGPLKPYANYFVEYAPLEHRILMWQNYLHEVSGLLYWGTTYWQQTKDPWTNIATWDGLYGDGSLLYPGSKIGINGPVSSIRLEIIRDAMEDYSYLWLLEQKAGRDAVLRYVKKLTTSWTEYTRDTDLFSSVRDEIAKEIENN